MKKVQEKADRLAQLRKRAENIMSSKETNILEMTFPKARQMLHELNTYQIELELQNEELRKAQEELEISRQRYTDLYDFAPVGYFTVSAKGLILEANLTVGEMLGVQRGHLINKPLSAFIFHEDQDIFYHSRRSLLESKKEQICELHIKRADGSLFYASLKNITTPEVDGSSGQFRSIITDISFQKLAEEKIKSLAKFPDENTNPVMRVNKDGNLIYANTASCSILSDWNCELGSIVPDKILMHVRQSLSTKIIQQIEIDHNERNFIFNITPISEYDYVNLYGHDITDLRRTEKALLESEEKFSSL